MKLRKLLCGSAAALIAVSVPLVGMNAFGEAGAPAATPTGTVETEEAAETAETTEVAVPESPVLSEDEIAHQKYLHGYNYTKKDNAITVSDMSFSTLWDNDRIVIKIKPYTGAVLKDAKLYLTSVSGTWEDKFVKDLSFVDDKDSIIVGDLRDEFDGSVIDDAKLKIVIGEGYDEIYYVQIKSESLTDEHPYDEWIKEANSSGKEEYVFYARNYDYIRDYYCSLPRKTQKIDKQNTKNPPEKTAFWRIKIIFKQLYKAILSKAAKRKRQS